MMYRAVPIGNYYYDPIIPVHLSGGMYPVPAFTGNPNYMGYYIYVSSERYEDYDHCLAPNECNFYLNGTKYIINTPESQWGAKPDEPEGLSFISLTNFTGNVYPALPYGFTMHEGDVTYGLLHSSPNPPVPLD
jgi:hypothetical protein